MVALDWDDRFYYGMFSYVRVRMVYERKPSYLVWTCCHTETTFSDNVMEAIRQLVERGPNEGGMTKGLIKKFMLKHVGGPW